MSTAAPPGLLTAEQFYEWANRPENADRHFELVDGEVVEMPSPGELHGVVCWLVARLLTDYLTGHGSGYLCTNDTGLIVARDPDSVRGPDVMLFLESRTIEQMSPRFSENVPALVVEVLSPSDRMSQVRRRVSQYHARGIPLVWVVEPGVRAVYVYRPNELPQILDETEDLPGNSVLPGFQYKVAALFEVPKKP